MVNKANLMIRLTILLFLVGFVAPATVAARIIYVDDDATGANDGSSWVDAYNYLQDALADASISEKPVEICVAQGNYKPDQGANQTPGDREATFQLISGVALTGGYAGLGVFDVNGVAIDPNTRHIDVFKTILSGDLDANDPNVSDPAHLLNDPNRADNSYHIVTGSETDATAVLDGFTITAGNANGAGFPNNLGAGIYTDNGSPTVANCVFKDNSAGDLGGGMYNNNHSDLTITGCNFSGNTADSGGGMYNGTSNPIVTDCNFVGNLARDGGGMYDATSTTMLSNCTFAQNSATEGYGGGLYHSSSTVVLIDCAFTENSAHDHGGGMYDYDSDSNLLNCKFVGNQVVRAMGDGGAMYIWSGSAIPTNCMFSGNSCGNNGGGIYTGISNVQVTNCTFSANSAGKSGGGIYTGGGSPAITNCIFWGNKDAGGYDEYAQIHTSSQGKPLVEYSCVQGGWSREGTGNIYADPKFINHDGQDGILGTEDDNLRLSAGSPCIDAANNMAVPQDLIDLDGDSDTNERIPWDLDGTIRFFDDPNTVDTGVPDIPNYLEIVDMGAYEVSESSG